LVSAICKNYISQGCGGIFNDILSQIFKESGSEIFFIENPLKIDKDDLVYYILGHSVQGWTKK